MRIFCAVSLLILLFFGCGNSKSIEIVEDEFSTSLNRDGQLLWTFNHDPAKGKPFFHPLGATDGTVFTDLPKTDHPWHRGLWFSWKKINEINYWEEKGFTGIPVGGYTRILSYNHKISKDKSIIFIQKLEYAPSQNADAILKETRTIMVSVPDNNGNYVIDWFSEQTPIRADIVLDRTPIEGQTNGKSFGGYAGLSVRMNKDMLKGSFLNSEGYGFQINEVIEKKGKNELHGQSALWVLYQNANGGSLLFMDKPSNFNYPSKWYVSHDMPYFSPAVIFDGPQRIKLGETLKLSYRILVSPNKINKSFADEAWEEWISK
ncbi:MAG: PmoA family protein [Jejuia sp.]